MPSPTPTPDADRVESQLELDDAVEGVESLEERLGTQGRDLRAHTARGVLINSAFQVGFAVLNLTRRVAVAAFLTVAEFGLWGLMISLVITLSWLKQIGINDKYIQQSDADQELAFQRAFTLELLYSTIFFALVAVALPVYAFLIYDQPDILVPGLVLCSILLIGAFQTPIWISYRSMRFVRQRLLEGVDPVLGAAVTIGLAIAGAGYWALVIGSVVGVAASALAAVITSPYRLRIRYDSGTLREYISFSWPLLFNSAAGLIVVQGSIITGNATIGLAGVAAIGLATAWANFVDRIDHLVRSTMYPAVCAVKDRKDVLFEAFVKSNRLAMMWGLPFGIGLALFGPDLITFVLGEKWRLADDLLQAAGLILGARQIAFNWQIFMRAVDWTRPIAVDGLAALGVFVVVTLPLMIAIGLTGYLIGMAAQQAVQLAIRGYFMTRLFDGFRFLRHIGRAVAPSVPAVAAILLMRLLESESRTLALVLAELGLYLAVTAIATFVFERRLLREIGSYMRRARARPAAAPTPAPS